MPLCSPSDLYCTLEVDSFGFFSNKAKTRVYRYTTEPKWNEVRLKQSTVRRFFLDEGIILMF